MTPEQFEQVERLFEQVLELEPAQRSAFLDENCQDLLVRREVDALLSEDDLIKARTMTLGERIDASRLATGALSPDMSTQVGPYRLVQQIGEGGFGVVYRAQQEQPVRREVALKIIKLGMDTRQVIRRFEAERQALAMMDHGGIARVLDAGATEQGRPFFVMELVHGVPITRYCDEHNLDTRQRLDLFSEVCRAVQHAHQKGIIHRDLKPTNVLVASDDDGRAVPKVIDFGIAKATSKEETEHSAFTQQGQFVGTPEYMSPEQAGLDSADIDTRSDIYSLGVMLYELLIGTTPFDSSRLRSAAFGEVQRIIREEDPPRPSTRLSTLGDRAAGIALRRRMDLTRLRKSIRGDLDWIIMKCLDKDRARRYDTASGLAADIHRHLNDEAVVASPPSARYRLQKLVRRHRGVVAAGAILMAVLLLGATGTSLGWMRALREQHRADESAIEAHQEASRARRVSKFLVGLFEASDPNIAAGRTVTARELLDIGARDIAELDAEPEVQVELRETMGWVYLLMGFYAEARPLLEQALAYRETHDDEAARANCLHMLANLHDLAGAYDVAQPMAEQAVEIRGRLLGDSMELTQSMNTLANILEHQGDLEKSEALHREALSIRERILPADAPDIAQSLHNLGGLRFFNGDFSGAEQFYQRAIEISLRSQPDTYHLASTMHTLAIVYQNQNRFQEALDLEQQALAIRERVLGPDHVHVAMSLTTLGNIYKLMDEPERAEPHIRRAVEVGRAAWGPNHGELWWMMRTLARTLLAQRKLDAAENLLNELVATIAATGREGALPLNLNALGRVYEAREQWPEAGALFQRAIDLSAEDLAKGDPVVMLFVAGVARTEHRRGMLDSAAARFEQAIGPMREVWGDADRDTLTTQTAYAAVLTDLGRQDAARPLAREVLQQRRAKAAQPAATAHDLDQAAQALLDVEPADLRDIVGARQLAERACAMSERGNFRHLATLARCHHASGAAQQALDTQREALALLPPDSGWREFYSAALQRYQSAAGPDSRND